jgi:cytoskeletal protein CcmA (bactofilin family)
MKYLSIVTCLVCSMVLISPVYAMTLRTGESVQVAADETVNDDIILFGQNIDVDGNIEGNVYAFGQAVRVTGSIGGSVYTGGANITIEAKNLETIWAGGARVEILSDVNRNAVLAAGQILVGDGVRIGKDLAAYSGKLTVDGSVGGTLSASRSKRTRSQ